MYRIYYNKTLGKAFIVGDPDQTSLNPCNLAESSNAGFTWSEKLVGSLEPTGDLPTKYLEIRSFSYDNSKMYLFGYRQGDGGPISQQIYRSTDGGISWPKLYNQFTFMQAILDASVIDDNIRFLTITGRIYRSDDGGATWQSTDANLGAAIPFSMKFVNDKVGWLASVSFSPSDGNGGVYRTVDGGIKWSLVKPGTYAGLSILSNPVKLVVVGSGGAISILEPPTISSLSKTQLLQGSTETISIYGTGFESAESTSGIVNPTFQFNKTGISVETVNVISSTEISATIKIDSDAELGQVDMTLINVDTTATTEVDAFFVGAGTSGMTISSVVPSSLPAGTFVDDITVNGLNMPNPGITGTMEINLGAGIFIKSITWLSNKQVSATVSIEPSAVVGARNISIVVKGPTGETIATASKLAAFTVEEAPNPGDLPKSTDILPAVGASGVWNPEKDGDLHVQVKVPVAGDYEVMVATPSGIKHKRVWGLPVGYYKIVIPSNLELTNGTHVLMLRDPRTGKLVKAKVVVNR